MATDLSNIALVLLRIHARQFKQTGSFYLSNVQDDKLFPIQRELLDAGLIKAEWKRNTFVGVLTDTGKAFCALVGGAQ